MRGVEGFEEAEVGGRLVGEREGEPVLGRRVHVPRVKRVFWELWEGLKEEEERLD